MSAQRALTNREGLCPLLAEWMPVGPAIRRLLGPRLACRVGANYRAIYVDLAALASALASVIPRDAHVLDVGGGDGQPLNYLLAMRSDLSVTTMDPAPVVGRWIDRRYDNRVTRLPSTSLADYVGRGQLSGNVIMIADVMHHIPVALRYDFLSSCEALLERVPGLRIVVKDVEPGYLRASLGFWSDRYITGDRNVSPISRDEMTRLFQERLGPLRQEDTNLFKTDSPNYALVFYR